MNHADRLLPGERKAAFSIAALYLLRMLGLFMILPVFALYAEDLAGATPLAVGLAIGAYGLTQAALQIPFGLLSDRFGRKRVIYAGLLLFALGSVIAATADHIIGVIAGRALQGAGAIAAAVMALAADLSREEQRSKVMAVIGASIGFSFACALVLGPLLDAWIGVQGIFWLTAAMALGGVFWVWLVVPTPARSRRHRDTETVPALLRRVLRDPDLLRLDASIFLLHMLLTASFVALPLVLRDRLGLPGGDHWLLYLPAMLLSLLLMVPAIILAERKRLLRPLTLVAVALLGATELWLLSVNSVAAALVLLLVFFTAINFLEAILPSLVARFAPPDVKGTALGAYSTSQFLGAFCGGAMAGWLHGVFGLSGVFVFAAAAALVWLAVAWTLRNPRYLSSYLLNVGQINETEAQPLARRLLEVPGVAEAVVIAGDGVAYLKVDRGRLDKAALQTFSVAV